MTPRAEDERLQTEGKREDEDFEPVPDERRPRLDDGSRLAIQSKIENAANALKERPAAKLRILRLNASPE